MVLDEATNASSAPSDSFADNAYPSDADPYAASNGSTQQRNFRIDLNDFPMPPPILGPLVGYPRQRVATNVTEYLKAASHVLHRPLSEEEAKALTYHTTKANSTTAYGSSAGAALAMARCYQTRRQYRFPFWNPSSAEGWNAEVLGPLRGQAARVAYQLLRIPPYWFIGAFTAGILAQSYSTAIATISITHDERLKALNEAIQTLAKNRGGLPSRQPAPRQPAPPVAKNEGSNDAYDDMSPASGAYPDSSVFSDEQARASEARQQAGVQARWEQQNRSAAQQASSYDDDASPTGGLGPMDSGSSSGGGSAWDRIRQQASSGQGPASGSPSSPWGRPAQQKEQRTGSTLGDSFTFSNSDEERQLAKSEAQREFDERVERERRGVDFNEGGKRW
ncbi:hypothetical protein GTA08_BOTSDO04965 [Botryosphaeria dothidea]|uniref:Uncharacterized protein n=1 Tax=Botryosphaeria dothidea TaxID=55169 RepID=A0A8H4ITE0_9PEZI|nr:hypothetical protein GTA08_BOTSDO04965 [Botryosphaeria dothidea]